MYQDISCSKGRAGGPLENAGDMEMALARELQNSQEEIRELLGEAAQSRAEAEALGRKLDDANAQVRISALLESGTSP